MKKSQNNSQSQNNSIPSYYQQLQYQYQNQKQCKKLSQKQQKCQLCKQQDLTPIISNALFYKHATPQDHLHTKHIQDILENNCTKEAIDYNQQEIKDQDVQRMRRYYLQQQWNTKISMLSEYYKFHRDMPLIFDLPISKILAKYHDKMKKYDYKRIKQAIKQEKIQNGQSYTSLSSLNSDSEDLNSSVQIKSKYSNVLENLNVSQNENQSPAITEGNQMQESKVLLQMCEKIEEAFGQQYSPLALNKKEIAANSFLKNDQRDNKFQKYIQNQSKKHLVFKKKQLQNFKKQINIEQNQKKQENHKFDIDLNFKFRKNLTDKRQSIEQTGKVNALAFLKRSKKQGRNKNIKNFDKIIHNINKEGQKIEPKKIDISSRAFLKASTINNNHHINSNNNLKIYVPKANSNNTVSASTNNSIGGIKINTNTLNNVNNNIVQNNNFMKKEISVVNHQNYEYNKLSLRRNTVDSNNVGQPTLIKDISQKSMKKKKTIDQIYKPAQNRNNLHKNSIGAFFGINNRSKSTNNLLGKKETTPRRNIISVSSKQLAHLNTIQGKNLLNSNQNRKFDINVYSSGAAVNSQSASNLNRKSIKSYSHSQNDKSLNKYGLGASSKPNNRYNNLYSQHIPAIKSDLNKNINFNTFDDVKMRSNTNSKISSKTSNFNSKQKSINKRITIEQLLEDKLTYQVHSNIHHFSDKKTNKNFKKLI